MKAAVDIGTNSMRLLVVDGDGNEVTRMQEVTGLGQGVSSTGRLSAEAIARTVAVLARYGEAMREHGVTAARAVATSASRDASNREEFFDRAEQAMGLRPELITGVEEAELSFTGATAGLDLPRPHVVVDIGGGSTEFVWGLDGGIEAVSVDVGSVRLTERLLPDRPADFEQLVAAYHHCDGLFSRTSLPEQVGTMVGVAGTWTSLGAIGLDLPAYDRSRVHLSTLTRMSVDRLVVRLAALTIEATARIPALDPKRAPVILGGAVIARETMRRLGALEVVVSEHDLLDGIVARLA